MIELVTVVAILGVLSAVCVASLTPTQDARQSAAARHLASHLNRLREHALTTGVGTWASFNVPGGTCSFLSESTTTPGRANAVAQSDPDRGGAWVMALGSGDWSGVSIVSVSVGGGATDIGFDWMGRPVNAAGTLLTSNAVVTLTGSKTVTVRAGSGLATTP